MTTTLRNFGRSAGLFLAAAALSLTALTACSSDNVSCGINSCTVTIERGVDASVEVLGVEAKLVGMEGDLVTVEVAGERLRLTAGQEPVEVAGLQVSLSKVTADNIELQISR